MAVSLNRRTAVRRFVLAGFLFFTAQVARAEGPVRLRVMSYNIHHGEGMDRKLDLQRLARVIMAENPDLVSLQEVDQKTERTGKVDQPAELGRLTGLQPIFGGNIPYQGGRYGNAILSRFPAKLWANHPLKSFYKGEQRGMMEVEIELPGGRPSIFFYATHLDYRGGSQERPASALQINELLASTPKRRAILVGDLNDRIGSETIKRLETSWLRVSDPKVPELPTFPADMPNRQIDFILVRPASSWKVIETRVVEEPVASDHRPMISVLELID